MASSFKLWWDKHMGGGGTVHAAKKHIEGGAHAVRAGGEAVIVGGLLGAADSHLAKGLDVPAFQGSGGQTVNVPIDGAAGLIGLGLGTWLAHEEYGQDLRNSGAAALAVFTFRKSRDYTAAQMRTQNQIPGYQQTPAYQKTIGVGTAPAAHGYQFAGEPANQPQQDPIAYAARALFAPVAA